jgi:hypothetical protein
MTVANDGQQIVGPEPREASFASSVIRLSCPVAPWPGQLRRWGATHKMKTLFSLIVVFLIGCGSSRTIEQKIGQRIDTCPAQPCIVRITDVTDFPWDQMHVFEVGATPEQIEKSLGTTFPDYVEFTRQIIFLKNGKIIHREEQPTSVEHPENGQVAFAETYTDPHWVFTPANAVFRGEQKRFSGGVYYLLVQVK